MIRSRYNIRTLLIIIAVIAICLAAHPRVRRHLQWRSARVAVQKWAENLKRAPQGVEQYTHLNLSFDSSLANPLKGISYSVLTAEPEMAVLPDGTVEWTTHAGTVPDPSRFFVIPPGKWVDDIDGVIEAWDRFQADGYKH